MKKSIKIIAIILIIILIAVGIFFGIKFISDSASKINEEYENDKAKLQENYDKFTSHITEYNASREDLGVLLDSATYYEDLPKVYDSIQNFYISYDELINKIMLSVKEIEKSCKREYMEEEYNSMCDSYQMIYEKMINVYLEDVNIYNNLINEYNNWVSGEQYSLFQSQYVTDYIDYNSDGVYEGKADVNE